MVCWRHKERSFHLHSLSPLCHWHPCLLSFSLQQQSTCLCHTPHLISLHPYPCLYCALHFHRPPSTSNPVSCLPVLPYFSLALVILLQLLTCCCSVHLSTIQHLQFRSLPCPISTQLQLPRGVIQLLPPNPMPDSLLWWLIQSQPLQ